MGNKWDFNLQLKSIAFPVRLCSKYGTEVITLYMSIQVGEVFILVRVNVYAHNTCIIITYGKNLLFYCHQGLNSGSCIRRNWCCCTRWHLYYLLDVYCTDGKFQLHPTQSQHFCASSSLDTFFAVYGRERSICHMSEDWVVRELVLA